MKYQFTCGKCFANTRGDEREVYKNGWINISIKYWDKDCSSWQTSAAKSHHLCPSCKKKLLVNELENINPQLSIPIEEGATMEA